MGRKYDQKQRIRHSEERANQGEPEKGLSDIGFINKNKNKMTLQS